MKIKASLIIFTLLVGMGTTVTADDHKEHNKKMMDKKHDHAKEFSKYNLGYWDANACKRTSDGAGALMATTGYLLDQSNKLREVAMNPKLMICSQQQREHPLLPRTSRQLFLRFANLDWCVK